MFGCNQCSNADRCTACKANFTLNSVSGKCVCNTISVFGVEACAACYKSIPNCLQCNQTACNQCETYYHLENGRCVRDECSIFACTECNERGQCIACKENSFLLNNVCVCNPDSGFYINMTNNKCERCTDYPLCNTCINSTKCT